MKNNDVNVDKKDEVYFINRTKERIPNWALKPTQYNHKILRAFLKLADTYGKVTKENLKAMCTNKELTDTYVPTFASNFAQMITDTTHSHGKVFDVVDDYVSLYDPVASTVLSFKDKFLY